VRLRYAGDNIFVTEAYDSKSNAKRAAEAIKKHSGDAEIEEV